MVWQEDEDNSTPRNSQRVTDAVFVLEGKTLPNVYEHAVFEQLRALMPEFGSQNDTGILVYFSAEEGNGWYRGEDPNGVMYLSRRARLVLRVAMGQLERYAQLSGATLTIGEHRLKIGEMKPRALTTTETLYARHVVSDTDDEPTFERKVLDQLTAQGIRCRKMVCGRQRSVIDDGKTLITRSVMLADLKPDESILLQEQGIGTHRHLGCGILIPHKGIR